MSYQQRRGTKGLAAVLAAAMLTSAALSGASTTPAQAEEMPNVSVGYFLDIWSGGTVAVAEEQDYFTKAGLTLDAQRFTAGAPALAAISSGELDISYVGLGPMAKVMNGAAQIVGFDNVTFLDQVLARPDTGINSVKDLAGKQVMTVESSGSQVLLRLGLKQAGLKPDDVKEVAGTPDSIVSAMVTDRVPSAAVWAPFNVNIQKQVPGTKVLLTGRDFYPNYVWPGFWMANKDFVENNRDTFQRTMWAIQQATTWRAANLEESGQLAAQAYDPPKAVVDVSTKNTEWMSTDDMVKAMQDGTVDQWLDGMNEQLQLIGNLETPVPKDRYFNSKDYIQVAKEGLPQGPAEQRGGFNWIWALVVIVALLLGGGAIVVWRRARI